MLHRAGCITDTTCYYVFHLDTEKISGPSLLAKIIQYSEMKSDKYTRCRNENDPAARKYFVETQDARHEKLMKLVSNFTRNTHALVYHLMVLLLVIGMRSED